MTAYTPTVTVEVHLGSEDLARALREDVQRGLTSTPKRLPPKWFYDERGSALFDEITRILNHLLNASGQSLRLRRIHVCRGATTYLDQCLSL